MKKYKGFTLIEILVSLAILALIGSIVSLGLQSAIRSQSIISHKSSRLAEVQQAIMIMERDIAQIVNRPVVIANGYMLPAFTYQGNSSSSTIEFTRMGFINPFGIQDRSTMQRVAYTWDGQSLLRSTWRVLDRTPELDVDTREILSGVSSFSVFTLSDQQLFVVPDITQPMIVDPNNQAQINELLPPPRALRIVLVVEGIGNIDRVIPVPAGGI